MFRKGNKVLRGLARVSFAAIASVAILMRVLVPAGFMPALAHGLPQLIVCDAGMSGSMHHEHHGHHGHPGSAVDMPCPFAMSGGAAPLPELPVLSVIRVAVQLPPDLVSEATVFESPPRYTAPRGPPEPSLALS